MIGASGNFIRLSGLTSGLGSLFSALLWTVMVVWWKTKKWRKGSPGDSHTYGCISSVHRKQSKRFTQGFMTVESNMVLKSHHLTKKSNEYSQYSLSSFKYTNGMTRQNMLLFNANGSRYDVCWCFSSKITFKDNCK